MGDDTPRIIPRSNRKGDRWAAPLSTPFNIYIIRNKTVTKFGIFRNDRGIMTGLTSPVIIPYPPN